VPRAGLHSDAVVAAAARLADAEGLHALTLARLALQLGVRAPSLYAHVHGLDDLRRRLGARGARELGAALGEAAVGRARLDALRAMAHAYRAYAREHPGSYAAAQQACLLRDDPEAADAMAQATEVALNALRGYGISGEDAVHATRIVRVALHGFVTLEAAQGFGIELPLDETFERLIVALDRVLRAGD
jgi:AcrR family transcriptional regulator